jgi:uncharacterized protein YbjT (DUF2867 family)
MDWQISGVAATNGRTVTVFGGTGFLGRRIVRHLGHCEFAVRIASRRPDWGVQAVWSS